MRYKRNFDTIYWNELDPWSIGEAMSERYSLYLKKINEYARGGVVLEMGCAMGAFLNRISGSFEKSYGFDVSGRAINNGKNRYPHLTLGVGNILKPPFPWRFDCIVISDVLYYVRQKERVLHWVNEHLHPTGFAFIGNTISSVNCPTPAEWRKMVAKHFYIVDEGFYEPEHVWFIGRPKRKFAAVTIDTEDWEGYPQDLQRNVILPAEEAMELNIPITFFLERSVFNAALARKMLSRGHDVQPHFHIIPDKKDIAEYKTLLESIGSSVKAYRSWGYRKHDLTVLTDYGINIDSSVTPNMINRERGFDYRDYDVHPGYRGAVFEIPITTVKKWYHKEYLRWSIDDKNSFIRQTQPGFYVCCGHTKGEHDWKWLKENLTGYDFLLLVEMARLAKDVVDHEYYRSGLLRFHMEDVHHSMKGRLCGEMAQELGKRLWREGFEVRYVSTFSKYDSHEFVEAGGHVLDPTNNIMYSGTINDLRREPKGPEGLYSGSTWFRQIVKVRRRRDADGTRVVLKLKAVRKWVFEKNYQYTLAYGQVIPLISFSMMAATFFKVFGFSGWWVLAMIPFAISLVVIVGKVFDRFKVQAGNEEAASKRSLYWKLQMEKWQEISDKVDKLLEGR